MGVGTNHVCPDHDDYIPRESAVAGGSTLDTWVLVKQASSANVWYNALPSSINQHPASDFFSRKPTSTTRPVCFTAPPSSSTTFPLPSDDIYFSIAMNSKLIQGSDPTIKVSAIKLPSATVFFFGKPPHWWNRWWIQNRRRPISAAQQLCQPLCGPTRGVGNIAFADGHAQGYKGGQVVDTTPVTRTKARPSSAK